MGLFVRGTVLAPAKLQEAGFVEVALDVTGEYDVLKLQVWPKDGKLPGIAKEILDLKAGTVAEIGVRVYYSEKYQSIRYQPVFVGRAA